VLKQHQADLKVIFDPLKARLEDLQAEANRISAEMASTPGLIGQGSELRHANRLKLHHDGEVETYVYGDVAPDPNGGPMKIITEATIVAPTTSEAVVPSTWSNEKALPGPAE
jgi:hypothetical protein